MRYVKPLCASVLTRTFEYRGRFHLGVSVLLFSPLGDRPSLLPEQDLWPFWARRPEAAGPLEESFPRSRAEYLLGATAYTRPGQRQARRVRAEVGALAKELAVFGPRWWDRDRPTAPREFEALPLDWTRTYGGPDLPENPAGMGRQDTEVQGVRLRLLPQVEYPTLALTAPDQFGRPAGFGPLDQTWAGRARKRGTYDEGWLQAQYPGIARDTDWSFFNLAPEDQQQAEPFRGDESYAFTGLHPERERIAGRLPGVRARVFATRRASAEAGFQEVPLGLMALWFFPAEERLIQVFQGWTGVTEDDAADVEHLLTAVEYLGQPRPPEHYLAVRERRLDRRNGALEALRESDLVPADLARAPFDFPRQPMPALERGLQRARRERLAARELVASYGLDPDQHGPPAELPPAPEIRTLDDLIATRARMEREGAELAARAEAEKRALLDSVRPVLEAQGQDFSLIEREVAGDLTRGPPKPGADDLIANLTAQVTRDPDHPGVAEIKKMLADPELIAGWRKGDRDALDGYRRMGQHQQPAPRLPGPEAAAVRQRVQDRQAAGGSLAGWDLTGADLSGLDLSGADLRQALLENADLTGTRLSGADLGGAMLARARLAGTRLDGARLAEANLARAELEDCDLAGADLGEANLEGAQLRRVRLTGARLDGLRLEEARLEAVDFGASRSEAMLVLRGRDLRGCRFAGAEWAQAVFVECDLSDADFTGAHFRKAAFVTVQAVATRFRGLTLGAGCFAAGCRLEQADFSGAVLPQVSLRGAQAAGADFRRARLEGADLSECDLRGSRFPGADARGARLVRARLEEADLSGCNLAGAVLQHALLGPTDFRFANLHEADLARVRIGAQVRFDGALFSRARTRPRHQPPAEPTP
jgi:uncharacterized protein YjbI with pentapeptide repeats